jgi:alpha-glucosidase
LIYKISAYYGDEIGMVDEWISFEDTVDILACNMGRENYWGVNRDPARTPMQCKLKHKFEYLI